MSRSARLDQRFHRPDRGGFLHAVRRERRQRAIEVEALDAEADSA